ncbi:MFS transporter [Caldibacillus lycopersici]|uniref:MFS transporter n=1 Tax=Perspicuibacillus lycopersici TaxID=1325689 RepID=A0AAE3ITL4_9BACI|nr:MFS transporter [Perspicuibacillus lycopersici]MCU9613219.1 MFS transporter [Perspicuibacillus lycopersici]
MVWKKRLALWKYPLTLLLGIGVSNLGEWIYFLSLNLLVFHMTDSPLAVSGLYIIGPIATLCTNFWSGSLIDRINKRKLLVFLDIFRALVIAMLPFMSSIVFIYFFVFIINMANSIFAPTSMVYITKLIPIEHRKRFNSFHSLITSGAFLLGPAVAGLLFLVNTPIFAIYINAIALFFSGMIMLLMPDLEKDSVLSVERDTSSIALLKRDWKVVTTFSVRNKYVAGIYLLFNIVMVIMASAVDSLEAVFAKEVLLLTDSAYGFLVTLAGAGVLIGALVNTVVVKNMKTSSLIGFGTLFVAGGYIIYAFSSSFTGAAIGFIVLAFFMAFANSGYLTFYQNNIPVEIMGRVGSVYGIIKAILLIVAISVIGVAAQFSSIQLVVIIGVMVMLVFSILLAVLCILPSRKAFYITENIQKEQ